MAQTAFSGLPAAIKSQAVGLLKPLLENESVELAHLGCEVRLFEKDKSGKKLAKKPNDMTAKDDHAGDLHDLSVALYRTGHNEQAVGFAKQALDIQQRLAQKTPARYEFGCYATRCDAHFLKWLSDETLATKAEQEAIKDIPGTIADHNKPCALFFSLFAQACMAVQPAQRSELFKQTVIIQGLSKADQHGLQPYFLCICAWLNRYEPTALPDDDWMDSWRKYHQQRQGRLPQWMQTVAERLEFNWPD